MSISNNNNRKKKKLSKDQRILAKNTLFSFLRTYGSFFLSIITSFLIARIISKEIWGFLIIALSYTTIFTLLLIFFPPSIGQSLNYYIPRYLILNQNSKLKSFILKSLIIRLMFVVLVFGISLLIFNFFSKFFQLNLGIYINLLYLLAPLIIINGLNPVIVEIYRGLNMFKTAFILLLIKYSVNIGGLIYLFLIVENVIIENIAFITLLASIIGFLFSCIFLFVVLFRMKNSEEQGFSLIQVFRKILKYGSYLSIKDYLTNFSREIRTQSVSFFESAGTVLGYSIAVNYSSVSNNIIDSLNKPLTISFSSLDVSNKRDQIRRFYKIFLRYTVFLLLLITGILYFLVDIFLFLVYTEDFLEFSFLLKLMLISLVFNIVLPFFFSLLKASNKVNYVLLISTMNISVNILLFLIGLLLFGIIGGVIGILITNIIMFIISSILSFQIFKIKLDFKRIILLYVDFLVALVISSIFSELFLSDLSLLIFQFLNLSLFNNFDFLTLLTFLILFLVLTVISKGFSTDDIENLETLFNKNNIIHKLIRRGLKALKKVMHRLN